jgi:hypothetical protein
MVSVRSVSVALLVLGVLPTSLLGCSEGDGEPGAPYGSAEDCDWCPAHEEPAPTPVTINITNNRATPVYLNQCSPRFEVFTGTGWLPGELMDWNMKTCEQTIASGEEACCGCEQSRQDIEPGATVSLAWTGLAYHQTVLPESCGIDGYEEIVCFQGDVIDSTVRLRVQLYAGSEPDLYPIPVDPFDIEQLVDRSTSSVVEIVVD